MNRSAKPVVVILIAVLLVHIQILFFIISPRGSAACSAQNTDRGKLTSTFSVPTDGSYRVWSRIKAPDATNNSFILQVDDYICGIVVGDGSIPANTWAWVNYQNGNTSSFVDVTLKAGSHTLAIFGREDSVQVDRILFSTDKNCTPSGNGDNCATAVVSQPNPGGEPTGSDPQNPAGSGPGSTVTIKSSSQPVHVIRGTDLVVSPDIDTESSKDVVKVEYFIDDQLVATVEELPFEYSIATEGLTPGTHTLVTTVHYSDGTTKSTTQTLEIQIQGQSKESSKIRYIWAIGLLVVLALIGALIFWQRSRLPSSIANLPARFRKVFVKKELIKAPKQTSIVIEPSHKQNQNEPKE